MIFSADELRHMVIRDTLKMLGDWSPAAENLLVGTAAQESGLGFCLKEKRLVGIYHISPATHRAIWDKYLVNHPELASLIRGLAGQHSFLRDPHSELVTNLKYATAIAWLIYKRTDVPIPAAGDIPGMARFWHRHFHARATGGVDQFIRNYRELVFRAAPMVA